MAAIGASLPLLGSRPAVSFDTVTYTIPNAVVTTAALRSGRLPQWNSFIFGGAPHLANPQAGVFYPLRFPFLWLQPMRAVALLTAVHLVVLAVGMIAWLGWSMRLRSPAPLIGALIVVGSGVVMAQALHFEMILPVAWAPWLLAAVDAAVTGRLSPRRGACAVAVTTAAMLLSGHPQPAYYALGLALAWAIARTIETRLARRLLLAGAGLALGFGVAAVQLVPAAIVAARSVRAAGVPIADQRIAEWLLPLRAAPRALIGNLAHQWRPVNKGLEAVAYVGIVGLALALAGLVAEVRRPRRRAGAIALTLSALVAMVFAAGPQTIVFRAAHALVPGFDLFRVPSRWLVVTDLALAALAALGVNALVRRAPARHRAAVCAVGVALVVVELAALGRNGPLRVLRAPPASPDAVTRFLSGRTERVFALVRTPLEDFGYLVDALRPNVNATAGVRSIDGYDGGLLVSKRWAVAAESLTHRPFDPAQTLGGQLRGPVDAARLAGFGVRWVLIDRRAFDPVRYLPGFRGPRAHSGSLQVWENPIRVRKPVPHDSPEHIEVRASGLVVGDQWDPGWHARVDGRTVRTRVAAGLFTSVRTSRETHTVELTYRTPGLRMGAIVTFVSLLAVALLAFVRRRPTSEGAP